MNILRIKTDAMGLLLKKMGATLDIYRYYIDLPAICGRIQKMFQCNHTQMFLTDQIFNNTQGILYCPLPNDSILPTKMPPWLLIQVSDTGPL